MPRRITSLEVADLLGISPRKATTHIRQCFKIKECQELEGKVTWERTKFKFRVIEVAILTPEATEKLANYFDYHSEQLQRASITLKGTNHIY